MERLSFDAWQIPAEIAGVLHCEDFELTRGRTGVSQRHRHAELELHLVLGGTGTYLIDGERVTAEPGTLIWVPPELDHILLDAALSFRRWMVLIRVNVVQRVLGAPVSSELLARRGSAQLCRTLPKPLSRTLGTVFSEVHDQVFLSPSLHNAGIHFALARAWVLFSRSTAVPQSAELHPGVARALAVLRQDAELSSIQELARRSGLSPSRLSKLFIQQVGLSVTEFRNRQRVERFVELFGDGRRRSLTEAALEAGFGSYPQFYRVFQNTTGCSPAEYARRLRRE